jgi:hypothetical protein
LFQDNIIFLKNFGAGEMVDAAAIVIGEMGIRSTFPHARIHRPEVDPAHTEAAPRRSLFNALTRTGVGQARLPEMAKFPR